MFLFRNDIHSPALKTRRIDTTDGSKHHNSNHRKDNCPLPRKIREQSFQGSANIVCILNLRKSLSPRSRYGEVEAEYDAVLTARGCEKAEKFVSFCDAFNIPVLTLVNVKGYKASKCTEKKIAKAAGRLTYAFANASVPKVTVVTGEAFGTAYLTMNSKSIGADMVYAWPTAVIGTMDPEQAVKIMYADEIAKADDSLKLIAEKANEYRELQSSAVSAAKRGYVDDIIEACDTRKRVIAAFEMLFTKREDRPDRKHGTV